MSRAKIKARKSVVKELPEQAGVYLFFSGQGPVYIGKAKNLRSRVRSYFGNKLVLKTKQMVEEAEWIEYIPVNSEFEALLLEAKLVRKHMPKYNSALKDDKTPLYIGITKEEYPRVLVLRQTQLENQKLRKVFGPYIDGKSTRMILRRLRKIFPFSTHKIGTRACVNSQIGLCSPCPSWIENIKEDGERERLKGYYLRNIKVIQNILSGRLKFVRREIEEEMKSYSEKELFEEAGVRLKQLRMLDYVTAKPVDTSVYLKDPNMLSDIRKMELSELGKIVEKHIKVGKIKRIECYDVAHLAGTHPTASMVTFIDGEPDKAFYRHFKLRRIRGNDDVGGMKEVLERRKKYFDDPPEAGATRRAGWKKPDLMIIDGGKGQVRVASDVIENEVPVVGLAKRYETLVFKTETGFESVRLPDGPAKRLVQRLRDESHRFARRYHHKLVAKALIR